MRSTCVVLVFLWILCLGGCGNGVVTAGRYPDAIVGADGQVLTLAELAAIGESDQSVAEKHDAYNDLGIEDPDLIDALIELFEP